MSTLLHTTPEVTHHQIQNNGIAPHTNLVKDLCSIIRSIGLGTATVTSHVASKSKGNVWVIKGPEKNPIVMLHYQNESFCKEVVEDVVTITDLDGDDCKPTCLTRTTIRSVARSSVSNNCKPEQRELPSNFKVKCEATCQNNLCSISCQQTSNVKNHAVRSNRCTFRSLDVASMKSPTAQTEQEFTPSFINAMDEHFTVEYSENSSDSCYHKLEQQNLQLCKSVNESEVYNKLACTIPVLEEARIIKSEAADIISCSDLILKKDSDCQLSSSPPSYISQNIKVYRLDQSTGRTEICLGDNELAQNSTEASIGIDADDCAVGVLPLDVRILEEIETVSARNGSDSITPARKVKSRSQSDERCRYCGKVFHNLVILKLHEERYDCQQVEKSHKWGSDEYSLLCNNNKGTVGHQIIHQRVETGCFNCSHCEATFKRLEQLTRHEVIHDVERSYQCSFCGKKFKKSVHRKVHERIHTGEKPYRCSYCGKTFSDSGRQKAHERLHTGIEPYQCSFCDKKFRHVANQKLHERIHNGDKPYQCSYCIKKFTQSYSKTLHERTHTGEKPYQCSHCDMKFKRVDHKARHERTHYSALYCSN